MERMTTERYAQLIAAWRAGRLGWQEAGMACVRDRHYAEVCIAERHAEGMDMRAVKA